MTAQTPGVCIYLVDLFTLCGMALYAPALVAVGFRRMAVRAPRISLVARREEAESMVELCRRPYRVDMAVLADIPEPGVVLLMLRRVLRSMARVAAYRGARRVREIPGRVLVAQLACRRVLRRVRHMARRPLRQMTVRTVRGSGSMRKRDRG